jgi:hypothetical protein
VAEGTTSAVVACVPAAPGAVGVGPCPGSNAARDDAAEMLASGVVDQGPTTIVGASNGPGRPQAGPNGEKSDPPGKLEPPPPGPGSSILPNGEESPGPWPPGCALPAVTAVPSGVDELATDGASPPGPDHPPPDAAGDPLYVT